MNYFACIFLLLHAVLGCSPKTRDAVAKEQQTSLITFSFKTDTLQNKNSNRYLDIFYKSRNESDCNISFRLFFTSDSSSVDLDIKSEHYLGSYVIGPGCNDKFRVPIHEQLKKTHEARFFVVPVDMEGKSIKKDLRSNFSFGIK